MLMVLGVMLDMFFLIEHILAQCNINQLKTSFNENTRKSKTLWILSCIHNYLKSKNAP